MGALRPNPMVVQKLKKLMTVAVALSLQKPEVNRPENTGTTAKSLRPTRRSRLPSVGEARVPFSAHTRKYTYKFLSLIHI